MKILSGLTVFSISAVLLTGCSSTLTQKAFTKNERDPGLIDTVNRPVSDDEAKSMLATGSKNWALGNGLGDTALKVGTSIVFPPYLIYLLGNGAIEMAGYHGIYATEALPESYQNQWNGLYDSVTSVPGRAVATVSGSEFRSKEKIKAEGGFWGRKGGSAIASKKDSSEQSKDDLMVASSSNSEMRNDLYGSDRSGS
jgi:hypothetical protein